jgi:hypothetical protein
MTVQQLRPPAFAGEIAAACAAITSAAEVPIGSLERWELGDCLAALVSLESRVAALRLEVLGEADRRALAEEAADTGTDAWASRLTGTTRGVMSGGIWLAGLLREKYAATRRAFASGAIGEAQVRAIVRAAEKMPEAVTEEQRAEAEEALVDRARAGMDARGLRQAGRRMLERISRKLADKHEADQLEDEKQNAEVETWLTLHDNEDGTFSGRFVIPELHGQLLRTALERLSAPRRLSRNKAGELVVDDTLRTEGPTLNWSEGLGAAFLEILEHLPDDGHGAVGATLIVHLDHQRLLDGLGSARLDAGVRISAGEARRLACGAGIVPLVLGGASEPLDVGRERRLHTPAMRRVLSHKHDSCAAEGCDRPFAWCEVHHPQAWSDGGDTSIENALPLCGHHHRRVHDRCYRHHILPSGEVRFKRRT